MGKVEELARQRDCSPSQLALAWILAREEGLVPIPGTTRRHRLEENAAAAQIELTPDEMVAIEAVAPKGVAAGERYDEMGMNTVDL